MNHFYCVDSVVRIPEHFVSYFSEPYSIFYEFYKIQFIWIFKWVFFFEQHRSSPERHMSSPESLLADQQRLSSATNHHEKAKRKMWSSSARWWRWVNACEETSKYGGPGHGFEARSSQGSAQVQYSSERRKVMTDEALKRPSCIIASQLR
jgi:hypothetical protein